MKHSAESSGIIKESILSYIGSETKRFTPIDISNYCKEKFNISSRESKKIIKNLITAGELEYSNEFGRSFIEISFSKPVKISDRLYLTPPHMKVDVVENEVCVVIEKGVSFGRGTHPTTRLCLQAIDKFIKKEYTDKTTTRALDIGTGSGVLVIAGVLFGISSAHACDIDNISINEAKKNIIHNKLYGKISVEKTFSIDEKFDFVFANLRYPTLIGLFETFIKITHPKSYLFLSGIKVEEKEKIIKKYECLFFEKIYEQEESGWMCFVFRKK